MRVSHRSCLRILAIAFVIVWTALAIAPWYRSDWLVENAMVILFVGAVVRFHPHILFSRLSYTLIFLFLCLHEIGAHYTYAAVPYDAWFKHLTGTSLNALVGWERNNFDRVVHFSYGLLLAYPVREIFLRVADVRGFWGYFLPLDLTLSTSALFELFEWGAAELPPTSVPRVTYGTRTKTWRWPGWARSWQ